MNKKNIGGLPADNRKKGDYKSKYPIEIIKKQNKEAIYISVLMIIGFLAICLAFLDMPFVFFNLSSDKLSVAAKTIYCVAGGLLGGAAIDMKCLYRAVSSGMWNEDRRLWRICSPIVSVILSLVMCAIFSDKVMQSSGYFALSIGFFTGYFSDEAVGKMYDVALVVFSRNPQNKDTKSKDDLLSDSDDTQKEIGDNENSEKL